MTCCIGLGLKCVLDPEKHVWEVWEINSWEENGSTADYLLCLGPFSEENQTHCHFLSQNWYELVFWIVLVPYDNTGNNAWNSGFRRRILQNWGPYWSIKTGLILHDFTPNKQWSLIWCSNNAKVCSWNGAYRRKSYFRWKRALQLWGWLLAMNS